MTGAHGSRRTPGLGSIKSLDYMASEAARAAATPADQAFFRAHDLNMPGEAGRSMIVGVDQWSACADVERPPREGDCTIGFDLGRLQLDDRRVVLLACNWPA